MVRVILPAHLRTLARIDDELKVDVRVPVTQRSLLDAIEERYPMLRGTIRDHVTKQRRPFLRFFACEEDLSLESPDAPLPEAIADAWYRDLFAAFRRNLKAIDGAADVLRRLAIPKCVASSSSPARLTLSLEVTGLTTLCGTRVFDASMVRRCRTGTLRGPGSGPSANFACRT